MLCSCCGARSASSFSTAHSGRYCFIQHTEEILAVPAGFLAVRKTGRVDRSPAGIGSSSETALRQPELVLSVPVFFLQRIRGEDQHLADKGILPGRLVQLRLIEQSELLKFRLVLSNKLFQIQHRGVGAVVAPMIPVAAVGKLPAPCLGLRAGPHQRAEGADRVRQHETRALEAVFIEYLLRAAGADAGVLSGAVADRLFDGAGAADIFPKALFPQLRFAVLLRRSVGVEIERNTLSSHKRRPPP